MKKTTFPLPLICNLNVTRHACLWAARGLLAVLAFGPPPAQAAVTEAWVHRYNDPANSEDYARAVAVDGSGNVVVTGFSYNGANSDYYTAKYAAADGALLWEQRYNGPANYDDRANAVAVDGSGNVVVTGYSEDDYYTVKYAAADGALLWERRYNGPANHDHGANALAVDVSGNVIVTGYSYSGINWDYYTAKYAAADGALLWEQRYDGPANGSDGATAVAVDGGGNVVVTGYSSDTNGNANNYTVKYAAADGALLWERRYNGPANHDHGANALAVDVSGNVIVTGYSYSGINWDYYTAKYAAANGVLLWEQHYYIPVITDSFHSAQAVAVDGSGNVLVTSYSSGNYHWFDSYTAKYAAADGALLWEKRSGGVAVAVDGGGNVVVTGYSDFNYDCYTAKYAAADGALLWEERYNGDTASSLALGPNGMVAVTGTSSSDYATVVYWENLPPVSIALVPDGIRLRFAGVPGHSYTIERTAAITGPWSTLATPTAPLDGFIEYVDTNPPVSTAFYRTSAP